MGLAFVVGRAGGVFTGSMICTGQRFVRRRGLASWHHRGVVFPAFLGRVVAEVGFYGAVRYAALLVRIPAGRVVLYD